MTDFLRVAPFAGVRYSPAKISGINRVTAPPYDMISPAHQEELYERDPHNVIRLILARDQDSDGFSDRYERAAASYRRWRDEGVLVRDGEPSLYAYRQDYEWGGKVFRRLGFIARVALTEFGEGAFPHESTLSGPKADRLRLLTSCRANLSSIFSLFSDTEGRIQDRLNAETASPPLVEFEDERGIANRLWRLSRPELHSWINEQMRDKQFIIADGHHRYETALEYRRRMRENPGGFKGDYDYVMMFLAPIESPGLAILPFHRLLDGGDSASIPGRLEEGFELAAHPLSGGPEETRDRILGLLGEESPEVRAFGLYPGGDSFFILRMKKDFDPAPYLRPGTSAEVAKLDVTVLHQVIFQGLLGLDESRLVQEGKVSFLSLPEEAIARTRDEKTRSAFFLRPTKIDQVWNIAVSGQKMPQKSTNFYPKLTSGMVFNEL